jgi:hypothetical protein
MYMQYIPGLCQHRLRTADPAKTSVSLSYNSNTDTWTVVRLTYSTYQVSYCYVNISNQAKSNGGKRIIFHTNCDSKQRHGITIETEVKIYAKNVTNQPYPQNPMCGNEKGN